MVRVVVVVVGMSVVVGRRRSRLVVVVMGRSRHSVARRRGRRRREGRVVRVSVVVAEEGRIGVVVTFGRLRAREERELGTGEIGVSRDPISEAALIGSLVGGS